MKRMLLISILIIPLSGCGVRAMQQTFHPQYAQWRDNDFSYHEYKVYSDAGLTIGNSIENSPSNALFWKNAGIPADQAVQLYQEWRNLGYNNSDIVYFFNEHITDPKLVDHWQTIFEELYKKENYSNKTTIKSNGVELKNNDVLITSYIKYKITNNEYTKAMDALNQSPSKIIVLNNYTDLFVNRLKGKSIQLTNYDPEKPFVNDNKAYQVLYLILNIRNGFSAQQSIDNITKFSKNILNQYTINNKNNPCETYEEVNIFPVNQILSNSQNNVGKCYKLWLYNPTVQLLSPKEAIVESHYGNKENTYYLISNQPIENSLKIPNPITPVIYVIGIQPKTFTSVFGAKQTFLSFKLLGNQ